MDYLLKSSGLVIVLFLFYYFFLKNETFFKSIRSYFLIGLIIVVAIPLVEIPIYVEQAVNNLSSINFNEIPLKETVIEEPFNWVQLFTSVYLLGVVIFSLKFLIQLISLGYLLSKHEFIKHEKYYYVETSKNISPFSFFNIIIYNKNQFSIDELEQIINHEKAHVLQWHSVDTILAHLLVVTLWFNPFVWLYRKAVQQNLEFLADAYALEMAENQKHYKLTLLKTYSSNYCTEITNNFYNSLIKKRIIMLHKNRSKNNSQWKYALLLPLLVGFIFTFNTKIVAQEKKITEIDNIDNLVVKFQFNKDSKDETLKKQSAFFKKQFDADISFKGIKRNNKDEITAIKITSKYKSNSSVFMRKSSEPISPIIITYNSEIDKINIGDAVEEDAKNKDSYIVEGKYNDSNKIIWHKDDDNHLELEVEEIEKDSVKNDYRIEVRSAVFISDDGKKTELILDEPIDASENVFIIKNDEKGQKTKVIKKQNSFTFKSDKEKPLVFINGKESAFEIIENITPDSIESMSVLKGIKATEKYGDKAKNGVIELITKKVYRVSVNVDENAVSSNLTQIASENNPLIIVNGKEVSDEEMKAIDPDSIKSVTVLKDESATKVYGEKGKNGVIVITLKKD